MERTPIDLIKEKSIHYYTFAQAVQWMAEWMLKSPQTQGHFPFHMVLSQYASRLSSFLLSIADDLNFNRFNYLVKGETNRILMRGCIESTLLIAVFFPHWDRVGLFHQQLFSDIKRINSMYMGSSPSRMLLFKNLNPTNIGEAEFSRRYEWVTSQKSKIPLSMVDLLEFVSFSSEKDSSYYELLIRNFDTFSHPSFKLAMSLQSDSFSTGNLSSIVALLDDNGIISETARNIVRALEFYLQDHPFNSFPKALNLLLNSESELPKEQLIYNQMEVEVLLNGSPEKVTSDMLASFFFNQFSLFKEYEIRRSLYPSYTNFLGYGIALVARFLKEYSPSSYMQKNVIFLLQDVSPRFDDFFKSYFVEDIPLFYVQVRYLLEAISMIYILLDEEEDRSKVFFLHQSIKGFESISSLLKYREHWDLVDEKEEESHLQSMQKYQSEIDEIKQYYEKSHRVTVDQRHIVRLNGWALYLRHENNEKVPNAPFLIQYAVRNLTKEITPSLLPNFNFDQYASGLYEESCTYSHVTSYAWHHQKEITQNDLYLREQFLVVSLLFDGMMQKLFNKFNFHNTLSEQDLMEINRNYTGPFSQLLFTLHKVSK